MEKIIIYYYSYIRVKAVWPLCVMNTYTRGEKLVSNGEILSYISNAPSACENKNYKELKQSVV